MENKNPVKSYILREEIIEIIKEIRLQSKIAIDIMKEDEIHPAIVEAYQKGVDSVTDILKERWG